MKYLKIFFKNMRRERKSMKNAKIKDSHEDLFVFKIINYMMSRF